MTYVSSLPLRWDLLLAARLLTGIGYVLTAVAAITLLMRITEGKRRTMVLALWSTRPNVVEKLDYEIGLGVEGADVCLRRMRVR